MPSHESQSKGITVLFTSAGRRVELLRAFREACAELKLAGRLLVTDIDPLAPAIHLADEAFLVPAVSDPAYPDKLVEICKQERVDLIFPLIDPDIPILARHRKSIERDYGQVVVVDELVAETTRDKWLTYELFQDIGTPTPRSWLPEQLGDQAHHFPLFVKPRFGSAGKKTFLAKDENELAFFCKYVETPIIQEFMEGPEITNDVTCGLKGYVLAVVSRQRIEVRWGEVAKGKTVDHADVRAECVRIANTLKAIGPITIQCMLHGGQPKFTEINARFGGGLPLGISAGVPSPKWYLAQATDIPIEIPPLGTYQKDLYITRYDESYFLDRSDIDGIESHRI